MTNERPENVWAATLPNGLRVRVLCKPDLIFMNESASRPEIVVRLEAEISGMASVSARMVASRGARCSRSSV